MSSPGCSAQMYAAKMVLSKEKLNNKLGFVIFVVFYSLNTKFLLNNVHKFSSYITGNTIRLPYSDKHFNSV
jgi:hypothetical protein